MGMLRDLFVRIKGDKSGLDSTLKGAEGSLNSFGSIVKKIGGLLGIAFGVQALVSFSKEAMKLAAEAEGVKNAFNNIAGSANLMNQMIKATRGAVDDSDLMSLAIKAQNLGIPLKDLGTLFEFATNRAITTGKSVNEMVELIVMGVGRKSSRALLQLGINTDVAGKAFKSVAGIMPVINSELDKMGSVADSAAIRIGALETNFKNLKEAWGGFLNNSKLVQTAVTNLTALFKMLGDESLTAWQKLTMGPKDYEKYINAIAERQSVIDNAKPSGPTGKPIIIIDPEEAKKEAEALEKLKKAMEPFWSQYGHTAGATVGLVKPGNKLAGGPAAGSQSTANAMGAELQKFNDETIKMMSDEEAQKKWEENWKQATDEVTSMISDAFIGVFENIGKGSFQGFGDALLQNFGRFIADFGKMLVAMGTAVLAARILGDTPTIPTALAAIAVGASAMAIGGMMMGMASKREGGMSSGSGGGGGSSSSAQASPQKIIIEGTLKGRDIYWSNRRYSTDLSNGT